MRNNIIHTHRHTPLLVWRLKDKELFWMLHKIFICFPFIHSFIPNPMHYHHLITATYTAQQSTKIERWKKGRLHNSFIHKLPQNVSQLLIPNVQSLLKIHPLPSFQPSKSHNLLSIHSKTALRQTKFKFL